MKRIVYIMLVLCAFFGGCNASSKSHAERSIQYAEEHIELLLSGAESARQKAEALKATIIIPYNETTVVFAPYYDREHGIKQENAILSDIFADGVIEQIQVRENSVEFSCGGAGIGPNTTYYRIIFTESGAIDDIFWYDSRMTYTEERGGFRGRLPDSDNTVFYYKITNNLFFFEAHF